MAHKNFLADDYRQVFSANPNVCTNDYYDLALLDLNNFLKQHNKSLSNYPGMPEPNGDVNNILKLPISVSEEMNYNVDELKLIVDNNVPSLNVNQKIAYDIIMNAIYNNSKQRIFFIDGPGGTGKTFLYNTVLASVRANKDIALAVASSGIAALLLLNGRTAHSRFKIPLNLNEFSTCYITKQSDIAKLIISAKLILWV
jgi:hypothetical protein